MDLYMRLWPLWLMFAVLAVNLLVALWKAFYRSDTSFVPANASNVLALLTAGVLAGAACINVLLCALRALS